MPFRLAVVLFAMACLSWSGGVDDTLSYPYEVRVNAYIVRVSFTA
jgi:hypothetical protein